MAGDMGVASLQNRLGLSETLAFDSYQRPARLNLTVPSVQAATYLQGAYMTLGNLPVRIKFFSTVAIANLARQAEPW